MERAPRVGGEYVPVYRPAGDHFPGPDSPSFRSGQWYDDWVPNDHCVLKGPDGRWHAFGITHPAVEGCAIHEGEWLSFHAVAPPGRLREVLRDGAWKDAPKVLPPSERPGERLENHVPFIVLRDGVYHMLYGPKEIRLALSTDLYHWEPRGTLFVGGDSTRDPCVLRHEGRYLVVYVTGQSLLVRESPDLLHWSDDEVEIFRMARPGAPESPVLLAYEDWFYLFWCIWDDTHGPYDHRTFVYRSRDPLDFHGCGPVAELAAHAPEVFQDEEGAWFISSAEWPHRGVSIAPLAWE